MTMNEIYENIDKWIKEMEAELPDIWDSDLEDAWNEVEDAWNEVEDYEEY